MLFTTKLFIILKSHYYQSFFNRCENNLMGLNRNCLIQLSTVAMSVIMKENDNCKGYFIPFVRKIVSLCQSIVQLTLIHRYYSFIQLFLSGGVLCLNSKLRRLHSGKINGPTFYHKWAGALTSIYQFCSYITFPNCI